MRVLRFQGIVNISIFATDHKDFSLSRSNGQVRKLGEVMLQDDCLNVLRGDLLCAISLV
jgi:hypothetical protein